MRLLLISSDIPATMAVESIEVVNIEIRKSHNPQYNLIGFGNLDMEFNLSV